MATFPT
jgi:hypothetical protein